MGLRVAYLTHYADLYGANRSLLDLMIRLRAAHHVEPFVLAPEDGPFIERLRKEGIEHRVLSWAPWMTKRHFEGAPHHRFGQWLRYVQQVRRDRARNRAVRSVVGDQLNGWKIDLVHVNSLAVGIAPEIMGALDRPVIWHMREMPEKHYGFHLDAGKAAYASALRKADARIAVSEAVRTDVQRYVGTRTTVDVVYNGVVSEEGCREWRAIADRRWQHKEPFTFLMAGVIHPEKGQREAIEALALVVKERPAVRLRIAGGGKADQLRELIHDRGLKAHVELMGFQDDLSGFYASGHTYLMCSRNEALGRVSIESMAHGIPVIGYADGGTLEVVSDGRTGLLYKGGPAELAERMLQLVNDPSRAQELGASAMDDAVQRFTIGRCAADVMDCYNRTLTQYAR
jgi:glycosyltransferase involved in cell wall biosynthesis